MIYFHVSPDYNKYYVIYDNNYFSWKDNEYELKGFKHIMIVFRTHLSRREKFVSKINVFINCQKDKR